MELKGGNRLTAVMVEPWPGEFVRLTNAKQERTFVPFSKVLAIRDDKGRDRTKDVLVHREVVGELPAIPSALAEVPRVITTPITSFVVGKDSVLLASRVERSGSERITATRVDGAQRSMPSYQVRWIRSLDGQEHKSEVLDHGKVVEDDPILIGYPGVRKSMSLRGAPAPIRSAFPMIQGGVEGLVEGPRHNVRGASAIMELGAMMNLNPRWSTGATAFLAKDMSLTRTGSKWRARFWFSRAVSIDAAPGVILGLADYDRGSLTNPGYTGEVALNFKDLVSITGGVEKFQASYSSRGEWSHVTNTWEETNTSWFFGVKLGGELGVPAIISAMAFSASRGQYIIY